MFDSKLGKNYISVIGKGPVAKLGKTGTDWEWVRLSDPAKEGKKTLRPD